MMTPFFITESARRSLSEMLAATKLRRPVLTLAKGKTPNGQLVWGVAVYEHSSLSQDANLVDIAGFEFYIDPSVEGDVAGATLDYQGGKFALLRKDA
jgi:hypothetical protein